MPPPKAGIGMDLAIFGGIPNGFPCDHGLGIINPLLLFAEASQTSMGEDVERFTAFPTTPSA